MTNPSCQPQYEPDANSITQEQVNALADQVGQLGETVSAQEKQCRKDRIRRWRAQSQLTYLMAARAFRRAADSWLGWRPAGMLIAATLLGGIFFGLSASWMIGLAGFLVGLVVSVCVAYVPSDKRVSEGVGERRQEVTALNTKRLEAADRLAGLKRDLSLSSGRLERWRQMLKERQWRESGQYRRQQLLRRNWKALRSVPFESFLEEVFRELGYVVETTKVTGDQGADLIVSTGGHRIAIQVKGYFSSVSNSAVQEAHTAKDYYRCEACAVVTNSRFTPSASDVAGRVGCILIDENNLPALVMGNIDLWQLHLTQGQQPQVESQQRKRGG